MPEKRITAKAKKEASRREPIDFSDPKNKPQVCNMFGCYKKVEPGYIVCEEHRKLDFFSKQRKDPNE